jgi:YggT family protein
MVLVARIIDLIAQLLVLLVFISAIVSWIMPPYHPVREALDRLVDPMLAPIRRFMPSAGGFDFSPLILIVLIIVINNILKFIFLSL